MKLANKNGTLLSLDQMIALKTFDYTHDFQFENADLKLIENTQKEFKTSLIEFELRLKGDWVESSLYKDLHQLFFDKLKQWEKYDRYHGQIHGKISETFLLNNKDWIFGV